jgi:predicted kinase
MKAIVTVGISASGKSTWTTEFIKSNPSYVEINRDDIRVGVQVQKKAVHIVPTRPVWSKWKFEWEKEVTEIQQATIQHYANKKSNIIISDTNLNGDRNINLKNKLESLGYEVEFKYFPIDFMEAVKRDNAREQGVGINVLRKQYNDYIKLTEQFEVNKGSIPALIFDVDGTIAHMGNRNPYEWHKVDLDTPDPMMQIVIAGWLAQSLDNKIVFLSGRSNSCESITKQWIEQHFKGVNFKSNSAIFMRNEGDFRKDNVVKLELFNNHVNGVYDVKAVFDDRPQVVRMWHDLGLKVWSTGDQLLEF